MVYSEKALPGVQDRLQRLTEKAAVISYALLGMTQAGWVIGKEDIEGLSLEVSEFTTELKDVVADLSASVAQVGAT